MEYYSAKEIASQWGITPRRVAILAKAGRIPGAWQTGRNWMIPKTAEKPSDPRKGQAEGSGHHSYGMLFLGRFDGTRKERAGLYPEEQMLYDAQEYFVHNRLEKAAALLKDLLSKTVDRYIRINGNFSLGMIAVELQDMELFGKCNAKMRELLNGEFPGSEELKLLFRDLSANSAETLVRKEVPHMSSSLQFDSDFYPYMVTNAAFSRLISQAQGRGTADTQLLELLCHEFDGHGYYYPSQNLHIYVAGIYFLRQETEHCLRHIRTVLDLAVKFDSYYPLAVAGRFFSTFYMQLLPEYPPETAGKLEERCKSFSAGMEALNGQFNKESGGAPVLSLRDYEYIAYAVSGMTIKEIAAKNGISEQAVNKHFASLYRTLGVKNKKEMIAALRLRQDESYPSL